MKKHNFCHRLVGWVERELEATLAILIVLAAIVGYSFAAAETTNPVSDLSVSQAVTFNVGGKSCATLSFDPKLTTNACRIRNIALDPAAPSDIATISGKGLIGNTKDLIYTVSVALDQSFSGNVYVFGSYPSGTVTLNGKKATNQDAAVSVDATSKLTLVFPGTTASVRGISTAPLSGTSTAGTVASAFVLPSSATMVADGTRTFIALVTDAEGQSVTGAPVIWSISTSPTGIATINSSTGEVTAKSIGTATVKATVAGKSASATVTIIAKAEPVTPSTPTASYPGAPDEPYNTVATATEPEGSAAETTPTGGGQKGSGGFLHIPPLDTAQTPQSILDTLAEALAPAAEAATTTEGQTTSTTAVATKVADALYAPTVVAERVATTGKINPANAEIKAVTKTMTLTQKIAFNLKSAVNQVGQDLRAIALGVKIVDANGKVVVTQPNAINLFAQRIRDLFSGAGAAPTGIGTGSGEGIGEID